MDAQINNLKEQTAKLLAGYDNVRLVLLFGSFANGRAGRESDLDIAVLCERPLTVDQRIAMIEKLAGATGRAVDLVDLGSAGIVVARSAVLGGQVLYSRDSAAYPEQVTRVLLDSADFLPYRERLLRERREEWIR